MTADGELLRFAEDSHPDLFWAIRGGGGNFGVATRFRFRLHEVGQVAGGMLVLPATPEVITSFLAAAEEAPDELSTIANVMPAPPLPFLPEEQHGRLVVLALMVYAGDPEAGVRAMAPFRALAPPVADLLRPMRVTQLRVLGGVLARVPDGATAFAHRSRRLMVNVAALYERPEEAAARRDWVEELSGALQNGERGAYVGFVGDEGEARVREVYPGATFDRLAEVKRRYDPTNLFRLNQNVPPANGR